MKRSMGVNWAYRVTRGFAHCHMEHAEGPSAPFFESPHSLSTITSVSLPIYTFQTRLFRIEQNKNTKKLFFQIILNYKKKLKENDWLRFKIRLCSKLCWFSWIWWFHWWFMGTIYYVFYGSLRVTTGYHGLIPVSFDQWFLRSLTDF